MKIQGINAGIRYIDSMFLPHDYINAMGGRDENVLKLAVTYNDVPKMKSFTSDYYLAYFDSQSKRLAFRAMKLMGITLDLMRQHQSLNNISQEALIGLVESYSEVFGIPLDGLSSFQKIKDMINNEIMKDINPVHLPHYKLQLYDIEKGQDYSKIRRFKINVRRAA